MEKRGSRAAGETMSEERRQPEGRMKSVIKWGGVLFKYIYAYKAYENTEESGFDR